MKVNSTSPFICLILLSLFVWLMPHSSYAQLVVQENFNTNNTKNYWNAYGGACLTASTSSSSSGGVPGCVTASGSPNSYYSSNNPGITMTFGQTGKPLPDLSGSGALRLTNGAWNQNTQQSVNQKGAILSTQSFPSNKGINITFNTLTYGGNGYQSGQSFPGGDGMSFFLIDANNAPQNFSQLGAAGGGLGYACTYPHSQEGIRGGYIGLGIDEYGNFGNALDVGALNDPLGQSGTRANTITLRGAGNINSTASGQFNGTPVLNVCSYGGYLTSGALYSYQSAPLDLYQTYSPDFTYQVSGNTIAITNNYNIVDYCPFDQSGNCYEYVGTTTVYNFQPVNAYPIMAVSQLTSGSIYSQENTSYPNGPSRNAAAQSANLSYYLKLTQTGFLSVSYSYNGGAYIPIISNKNITGVGSGSINNGPLPANFLFGFAAATGSGSNVHEIACFKTTQLTQSSSSGAGNGQQGAPVSGGTFSFLPSYNPISWTGDLGAYAVTPNTDGSISIASNTTWSANCVLTGNTVNTTQCSNSAQAPSSRAIAAWNGDNNHTSGKWAGIEFDYSKNSSFLTALNSGDSQGANRVAYLRGDRSQETTNLFRSRYGILGDIINSSPAWVGVPNAPYSNTWADSIGTSPTPLPENQASTNYSAFKTANASRNNIVYIGANDGFLHGFSAGSGDATAGTFNSSTNNGKEVLAYMPSLALNTIHSSQSNGALDFSGILYAHNTYVDATPDVEDVFYGGSWHTLLVGGLGDGGNLGGVINSASATAKGNIYAMDVTNVGVNETNTSVANRIIGDWNSDNLTCTPSCSGNLGSVVGKPLIRRLHSGNWGFIFGNGLNSANGTSGIFVAEITGGSTSSPPNITFHFIPTLAVTDPTGKGVKNGIAFVTPVDLDGDHITDYVYAGDALGNVWRFDLTSSNPSNWSHTSSVFKLFSASNSSVLQPITTAVTVFNHIDSNNNSRVMVDFGTGRQFPQSLSSAATFTNGAQYLYGIWDWNMSSWNVNKSTQYDSLASAPNISTNNLTQQRLTFNSSYSGTIGSINNDVTASTTPSYTDTNYAVCFPDILSCTQAPTPSYGWYIALPNTNTSSSGTFYEQVIFNPVIENGYFFVNTTIPPSPNTSETCVAGTATGYTYAIDAGTGGLSAGVFGSNTAGVGLNGVGSPYFVTNSNITASNPTASVSMITKTSTEAAWIKLNFACPAGSTACVTPTSSGSRLSWLEVR